MVTIRALRTRRIIKPQQALAEVKILLVRSKREIRATIAPSPQGTTDQAGHNSQQSSSRASNEFYH